MSHGLIALVMAVAGLVFWCHQEVATAVAAFYAGREHAQSEYRTIYTNYRWKRENATWWCGFEPRAWNVKSLLDWVGPVVVV